MYNEVELILINDQDLQKISDEILDPLISSLTNTKEDKKQCCPKKVQLERDNMKNEKETNAEELKDHINKINNKINDILNNFPDIDQEKEKFKSNKWSSYNPEVLQSTTNNSSSTEQTGSEKSKNIMNIINDAMDKAKNARNFKNIMNIINDVKDKDAKNFIKNNEYLNDKKVNYSLVKNDDKYIITIALPYIDLNKTLVYVKPEQKIISITYENKPLDLIEGELLVDHLSGHINKTDKIEIELSAIDGLIEERNTFLSYKNGFLQITVVKSEKCVPFEIKLNSIPNETTINATTDLKEKRTNGEHYQLTFDDLLNKLEKNS